MGWKPKTVRRDDKFQFFGIFKIFDRFQNSDPGGQFELTTNSLTITHLNKHRNTGYTHFESNFCVFARRHYFTYN